MSTDTILDNVIENITGVTLTFNDISFGDFTKAWEKLGAEFHGKEGVSIRCNIDTCSNYGTGDRAITISREPHKNNEQTFLATIEKAHALLGGPAAVPSPS